MEFHILVAIMVSYIALVEAQINLQNFGDQPILNVTGCFPKTTANRSTYQCATSAKVTLNCEDGRTKGMTKWEIKKGDTFKHYTEEVKAKDTSRNITLPYSDTKLGAGYYVCIGYKPFHTAASNAIILEDIPVLGKPTLAVSGQCKVKSDDVTTYQCAADDVVQLKCGKGQADGAVEWEIKKDGTKNVLDRGKKMATEPGLKYSDAKLGAGAYTCIAYNGVANATSDAIKFEDKSTDDDNSTTNNGDRDAKASVDLVLVALGGLAMLH